MAAPAIIVTGAAGGIGAAIAARLAADGHPLILLDRAEARLPDGAMGRTLQCDIADPVKVAATFATLRAEGWQVRALANVAGRNLGARVERMDLADWTSMIDINVGGMLAVAGAALPLMEGVPEAAIVNMVSVVGYMASAEHPADVATKAGVEGLTEGLARMLTPRRSRDRDRCRPKTQGRAMRPPTARHPRLSLWGLA